LTKGHLPNILSSSPSANWVINIFGNLGRMDLWQQWQGGTTTPVKVSQLICPSDSSVEPVGGLSYALNFNLGGRDLTSLNATVRTVLLSERLQSQLVAASVPAAMWNDVNPSDAASLSLRGRRTAIQTTRTIRINTTTYLQSPRISTILSSNHKGYINVTFCDGHTQQISQETYTWLDPENPLIGVP